MLFSVLQRRRYSIDLITSPLSITLNHCVTQCPSSPVGRWDRWAAACRRAPAWAVRSTRRSALTEANQTQRWVRWVAAARRDAPASARGWWPLLATAAAAALHRSAAPVSCHGNSEMFTFISNWLNVANFLLQIMMQNKHYSVLYFISYMKKMNKVCVPIKSIVVLRWNGIAMLYILIFNLV